jgi:hypothetical protein
MDERNCPETARPQSPVPDTCNRTEGRTTQPGDNCIVQTEWIVNVVRLHVFLLKYKLPQGALQGRAHVSIGH